jgi:hypothetical protein
VRGVGSGERGEGRGERGERRGERGEGRGERGERREGRGRGEGGEREESGKEWSCTRILVLHSYRHVEAGVPHRVQTAVHFDSVSTVYSVQCTVLYLRYISIA